MLKYCERCESEIKGDGYGLFNHICKECDEQAQTDQEKHYGGTKRLDNETWKNIFRNLEEMDEEDYYDGEIDWVEVQWLDGTDEWCLCYGEELFEDGFKTEREAMERLNYLEKLLLKV